LPRPHLGVLQVGRPRGACEEGTRWNRIALRGDDVALTIRFVVQPLSGGGNMTAMYVGGVLRSEVNMDEMRPYGTGPVCNWCMNGQIELNRTYVICRVCEWAGGTVAIGDGCDGNLYPGATNRVEVRTQATALQHPPIPPPLLSFHLLASPPIVKVYNVPIRFEHLPHPTVDYLGLPIEVLTLQTGDATVHTLSSTPYNDHVLLVERLLVPCPFSYGAQVRPATTLVHNGRFYRYDARIATVDNTIEAPASASSFTLGVHGRTCPLIAMSAPKTFLNEQTCVVTHGCSPDDFSVSTPHTPNPHTHLVSHTLRLIGCSPPHRSSPVPLFPT
jgi:hypothetical protein